MKPMNHINLSFRRFAVAGFAALSLLAGGSALAQKVKLSTNMGDIVLELDADKAPKTVENFLAYVKVGHYDGTIFHRVIDNFMIQGGGFDSAMQQKPTRAPIVLESRNGLKNERATVAMARTAIADSATSQFFINLKSNDFLNANASPEPNGYAVFAKVTSGMDVVDKIRTVATGNKAGHQNVPIEPIIIKSVTLEK
jgi:peptidyl-prolyl cis-trans isomerase A (cyclophilin A)